MQAFLTNPVGDSLNPSIELNSIQLMYNAHMNTDPNSQIYSWYIRCRPIEDQSPARDLLSLNDCLPMETNGE